MPTPFELIKQGIEAGDWKKVAKGYKAMTGETVAVPATAGVRGKGKKVVVTIEDVLPKIREQIEKEVLANVSVAVDNLFKVVTGKKAGNLVNLTKKLVAAVGEPDGPGEVEDEDEDPDEDDDDEEDEVEVEDDEEDTPLIDRRINPRRKEAEPVVGGEVEIPEEEAVEADDQGHAPNVPNSVEARAAEARAIARGEAPLPDFTHVQGRPEQDENPELGTRCRTEPVVKGAFKNEFVDDGTQALKEKKFDRKVTKGLVPTPRRAPLKYVKCKCVKCQKNFKVDEKLAPRAIKTKGGETETTNFVCQGCVKKGIE